MDDLRNLIKKLTTYKITTLLAVGFVLIDVVLCFVIIKKIACKSVSFNMYFIDFLQILK